MTATTMKLPSELRDRLKGAAAAHRRTMAEHVAALLDEEDRRARYASVREAMAQQPPDEAYRREAEDWQSERWS